MKGFSPKIVATAIGLIIGGAILNIALSANQQPATPDEETFTRPAPTRPIRPEIPQADRTQDNKVFLEQADSLFTRPQFNDTTERQIVKGNVIFRQEGMFLYCDSAYYYPTANSMDAFSRVRMEQGDTLFVFADKIFYDGNQKRATLTQGVSQPEVKLENRDVTLITDSLDYDMNLSRGWYSTGGRIDDGVNTLTSEYGEYSPDTKMAYFRDNVVLVDNEQDFTMRTEELDYNTSTHIAQISTHTVIEGENDVITTTSGWYNTSTDRAELTSRSLIEHRDSNDNVVTLEGDSIIYDKIAHISRAFMFADVEKAARPMVLTDTARRIILIGGYGEFNDSLQDAFATHYPMLMEFSRPDTIFLRADTIRSFKERHKIFLPLTPEQTVERKALWHADSIRVSASLLDSMMNDSIVPDSAQIVGRLAQVLQPLRERILNGRDSSEMVDKEYHVAKAWRRGRFFNAQMQGVADSITYVEYDSMVYLNVKPVIWSEDKQISGPDIRIHFNDTTADYGLLPLGGIVSQHADDDFYTQLSAKRMTAYFSDESLKRLEADGNVTTIFLPMEQDSTYNKLINAESSFLTVEMDGETLEKMKMWPEVTGTVTPIFMVKNAQKYLPGFQWLEAIRPRKGWYEDGSVYWDDELGEVPDELEQYFNGGVLKQ